MWAVNAIRFRKSKKSSLFYASFLIFDTWTRTARWGLRGTGVNRRHVEKSGRATPAGKVRVVSDAFHFRSDEPAFRIFRLGRSARASGRRGFYSSSHTHSLTRTHIHKHTAGHTPGARSNYVRWVVYMNVYVYFFLNSLTSDKDTKANVGAASVL